MNQKSQKEKPSFSAMGTGQYRDSLASDISPLGELALGKPGVTTTETKGILAPGRKEVSFHKSHLSQKSDLGNHEKAKQAPKPEKYSGIGSNKILPMTRQQVLPGHVNRIEMAESGASSPDRQDSELRIQKTVLAAGPDKVSRFWRKVQASRKKLLMMDKMAEEMDHIQFQGSTYSRRPVAECSIRHDSKAYEWLQVVRSISLVFIMIVVPLQFAFPPSNEGIHNTGIKVVLGIIDITHFTRTVLDACFISYQAESGYVVTGHPNQQTQLWIGFVLPVTDDVEIFRKFRR